MSLSSYLDDWRPGTAELTRRVDPWPAAAFAALIGAPAPPLAPGDPLPPLWHWFTLLEHPAQRDLGPDGHPADGPFFPPIPGRRRMFAGGRLRLDAPVPVGAELSSRSGVASVAVKSGRTGELAFVTVRHELSADGRPVGAEEQDIVYRAAADGDEAPPPAKPGTAPEPPAPEPPAPAGPAGWQLALRADPVLLFRFSALTYNAHRIHYDLPFTTEVEGHPGLVVHGPLLALLALELPRLRAPGEAVSAFSYRLLRPAFAPAAITATGQLDPAGRSVALTAGAAGARPSLTATAELRATADLR
jgi:3-methylfumaryl-CoA hydratase